MKQLNGRSAIQLYRCKTDIHGCDSYQSKSIDPFNHSPNLYGFSEPYPDILKGCNRFSQNQYKFRLTETYLLIAHAYGELGNTGFVTTKINAVRARSDAAIVTADNVNIDDILMKESGKLILKKKEVNVQVSVAMG